MRTLLTHLLSHPAAATAARAIRTIAHTAWVRWR